MHQHRHIWCPKSVNANRFYAENLLPVHWTSNSPLAWKQKRPVLSPSFVYRQLSLQPYDDVSLVSLNEYTSSPSTFVAQHESDVWNIMSIDVGKSLGKIHLQLEVQHPLYFLQLNKTFQLVDLLDTRFKFMYWCWNFSIVWENLL